MCLRGKLAYKGERGYSAYEIAVQNGFIGSEQDWLATLGTSSHFAQNKATYTTESANETTFDLPTTYTSNCFVDVYVEGERLNSSEYTINSTTNKVTLTTALEVIGTKVEVVMVTMSTNNLPIVTNINSSSDNTTTPGTKAVYDFVNTTISENYAIITGTAEETSFGTLIDYPEGFTVSNCVPISCIVKHSDAVGWYNINIGDSDDGEVIGPCLFMKESNMRLANIYAYLHEGYPLDYKIVLMKVGDGNE